jgi:hypothetical protein
MLLPRLLLPLMMLLLSLPLLSQGWENLPLAVGCVGEREREVGGQGFTEEEKERERERENGGGGDAMHRGPRRSNPIGLGNNSRGTIASSRHHNKSLGRERAAVSDSRRSRINQ